MTNNDFTALREGWTVKRFVVCDRKSVDYASASDRLENFKRISSLSNLDQLEVWLVYFMKHILAIANYVKNGKTESEPIEGRIDDAQNYLDLLRAFVVEIERDTQALEESDGRNL